MKRKRRQGQRSSNTNSKSLKSLQVLSQSPKTEEGTSESEKDIEYRGKASFVNQSFQAELNQVTSGIKQKNGI